MPLTPAQAMMARETRITPGQAPRWVAGAALDDHPITPGSWQLEGDEFLLRGSDTLHIHYRKGRGITLDRGGNCLPGEEALWLNGSVYAAVASINGLLPIHASAVAWNGQVHAFTGPSGAGKSTLIAALGALGLPMFCDDTLVLDLSDPDRIACLPGHKRLKLTPEALALTGAGQEEEVGMGTAKFYAAPPAGDVGEVLPLAQLVFLEEGPELDTGPISGAERMTRLQDDHYTTRLYAAAQAQDHAGRFAHLVRLARQIGMARLVRPRDTSRFASSVTLAAQCVKTG